MTARIAYNNMKSKDKIIIGLAAMLIGVLAAFWLAPAGLSAAPVVSFQTIDGRHISSDTLRGKPVLITFWATSCPGCMQEMPHLIELYRDLHPHGLEIVGVAMSYDPPSNVAELVRQRQVPYPIALDTNEAIAKAFGDIRLTPTSFLISPDGRILRQQVGEFDMEQLRTQIKELLGA
ncbi:peroxiredoxin family protein [Plasticicumulans acidivorans]|uniref:peroxiredoxin family protein n=1 Tax=Plasticicumulans acidivorans TaxID=886464 RepID=UPI001FE78B14|nr:TlpA disulfide reductase family protein [Plasticicumulans acidivorans]